MSHSHTHSSPPTVTVCRAECLHVLSREGDSGSVAIGEGSNVQDDAVLGAGDVSVGAGVTIGHGAIIKVCGGARGARVGG